MHDVAAKGSALDDEDFIGLMAELDATAAPAEPDAPETESAPTESESPVAAQATEPVSQTAPVATEPPVVETSAAPAAPAPPAWDSEENPHFAEAMQLRQLRAAMERQRQMLEGQQVQREIEELADGDSERLQKVVGLLTRTADPLQQQVGALNERAHMAEKQAAAMLVAMQQHLSEQQFAELRDEVNTLLRVEGVDVMESVAKSRKGLSAETQRRMAAQDARIKELELQLAARQANAQADATGAHTVDAGASGTVPASWYDRANQATTEDDYFDALFSQAS